MFVSQRPATKWRIDFDYHHSLLRKFPQTYDSQQMAHYRSRI